MTTERDPHKPDRRKARAPSGAASKRARAPWDVRTLVSALRRRLRLFLAVLGASVAAALLLTALQTPRYTATSEVVLGASDPRALPAARDGGAATEVRILESRAMAQAVADALRLDRDPEFAAPRSGLAGLVQRVGGEPAASPRDQVRRRVVDRLSGGLSVRQLEDTYSATISYTSRDPRTAARVANEYARQYSGGRLAGGSPDASPLDRPDARIISGAEPPLAPSSPRPVLNLTLALALGTVAGLIAAVLAERAFAGLTSGAEVETRLGLPHLGSVPTLASVLPAAKSPVDAVIDAPMSGYAEAFRGVLTAIRHAGGRGTQVIAITSALPNEGKTTITACLARTVALGGDPVVLVDCDSRRRDTSALFGASEGGRPGLAELLRFEATLDEVLVRDKASGAWVLPLTGPPAELSDLLTGAAMASLIEDLRRRFKRVLIDTAPILPISGTRTIATMVDVTVMVVRWRATPDHAILAALRLLPRKHVRIAGAVLSHVDMRKQVKYGHGDPTFYYQQYSKYYS